MESRISGHTKLFCLIGSPVGHSGSPAMYNYSFARTGVDAAYLAFDIPLEQTQMIQDVHGVGVPGVLRHVGKGRPALALPAPVAHGLDHQGAQLGPGQLLRAVLHDLCHNYKFSLSVHEHTTNILITQLNN